MQGIEDRIAPPERFAGASDRAHEQAVEKFGADDFGPDDYVTGLRVLLLSMDYDARFSERGKAIAWGAVVTALAARAFAVREMRIHPGFDERPIVAPVVITGIPRTGTTALHKLMAVDPQFQGLDGWLMSTPMPRPPRETWPDNPFFREAVERVEARYAMTPEKRALHAMEADEVDECIGILRLGFVSNGWASSYSAASYDVWRQTQSELASYQWLYRTYQLIGANEPKRRWLLKNPGHIESLDCLFAVFPDARVVVTHRDPAKAVPSLCSLLMMNHRVMEIGRADQRAQLLGIRETEKWASAIRRAGPMLREHADQVIDVRHRDFHHDPMATIRQIYDFAELDLRPDVRAAMERRIAAASDAPDGEHRYSAGDFGMTTALIRERFGDYAERFDLISTQAGQKAATR